MLDKVILEGGGCRIVGLDVLTAMFANSTSGSVVFHIGNKIIPYRTSVFRLERGVFAGIHFPFELAEFWES